jgi:hypothetical protein
VAVEIVGGRGAYPEVMSGTVPDLRPDRRLRRWLLRAWAVIAVLSSALVVAGSKLVIPCRIVLRQVPEPLQWREWPLASRPFADGGRVCPDGSSEARRLLATATRETRAGEPFWLRYDANASTFVIASRPSADDGPRERYVLAFHSERGNRYAVTSTGALAGFAAIGLSLCVMLMGVAAAYRRRRGDGASAGPVLVTSYRVAGGRDDVGLGSAEERQRNQQAARADRAITAIRAALLAVGAVFGVSVVAAGVVLASEVLRALM